MADWGRLKLMYSCKVIRYLRLKHKITTREMGIVMGISQPRYMEIELSEDLATPNLQAKVSKGIIDLIAQRKVSITALEADFEKYKDILLEQRGELT